MDLVHIGLVSTSESAADRFFGELLGLEKTKTSQLPAAISHGLFGVDQELGIGYYANDSMVFEVFFAGWHEPKERRISHTCIQVGDLDAFLGKCAAMDYEVRRVPKGDKEVVFLADHDGNLFEVK